MPQKQTAKGPQDPYAQQAKKLASTVQRIRGWVGSDPSRNAELGDALVELTAHRLLGHAYADAATEAQEAVVLSGKLLAGHGPIGPYTPVVDAVRYFTAAVHLAALQAGVGLAGDAGRTMQTTLEWQEKLPKSLALVGNLQPSTTVWALLVLARAALAAGDVEPANSYADAALDRLVEGGLADAGDSYLALDVHRLSSEARWAAGRVEDALVHDELAREQHDRIADGRLANPGRLSPGLLARLAEPLFPLHRGVADRLVAAGESDRGLLVRRSLIETLRGMTKRVGEPAIAQLAQSLDDLAADLRIVGRDEEAVLAVDEARDHAARLSGELGESVRSQLGTSADRAERRPGRAEPLAGWPRLDGDRAFAAATADHAARSAADAEAEMLRQAEERAAAGRAEAERLEEERQARAREQLARREAERAEAERLAQERVEVERRTAERAAAEEAEKQRLEAERRAAEEEAARSESKRRREERLEAHRLEEERLAAERREAQRLAAERALTPEEAERLELERLAAELAELERAEAERAEAERAEAERAEAERAEAERAEAERAEAERAEAERAEAERAEAAREETDRAERERQEAERLAAEQAEAERAEHERLQAERLEAERLEAERLAAEQAEAERAERERLEAERVAAEQQEAERAEREQAERKRAAAEAAAEPPGEAVPEVDELDLAVQEWQAAKAAGERRRARAANERVVELLRPRAQTDLATYGPQLVDALEQLSSIRLRTGDIFGSRAPSKEAKALTKELGR